MELGIDIQGNLLPNPLTMATQLLATLLIFLMFKHFLWKPVKEILAKRAQAMQDQLKEADDARAEAEAARDEARQAIEGARAEGRSIVETARAEASALRDETLRQADDEARERLEEAEAKIAQREQEMREELQDEVADLALLAAESLLKERATDELDRAFVDNFLKER